VRSLYPIDDAIGQMFKPSRGNFLLPGSKNSLKMEDFRRELNL